MNIMKFDFVVALFASSLATASAADANGYTGLEYTFFGAGWCLPFGSTTTYSYAAPLALGNPGVNLNTCAAHCQSLANLEGHVGFDTEIDGPSFTCYCLYTDGTGPVNATSEEGIYEGYSDGNTDSSGPIGGTTTPETGQYCYRRNAFTDSPSSSPSNSPSMSNSPSTSNGPSTSPSKTPTGSLTVTSGGAAPEDSLYYPDWSSSKGGCKTGGGQPTYMTLAASTWMFATLGDCCAMHFGWMLNECKGASGAAPSGLWFPEWAGGADDTCKNDGSEPEYMALNPGSWMHSSKQECCEANFGWMINECLGNSDPNAGATTKWYMVWSGFICKQDCVGTGPSCGGRAESWDQLFETRAACCAEKAAWDPTDCLVD